jgi:hypothetical protein
VCDGLDMIQSIPEYARENWSAHQAVWKFDIGVVMHAEVQTMSGVHWRCSVRCSADLTHVHGGLKAMVMVRSSPCAV